MVASAVYMVMLVVGTMGVDKLAMYVLPASIDREDWSTTHGFLRFGVRRIGLSSFILALVVISAISLISEVSVEIRAAIIVSCLILPVGALVHFGIEVMTSAGREIIATAILRVLMPATTLVIVGLCAWQGSISGPGAILVWGVSWMFAGAVLASLLGRRLPTEIWASEPRDEAELWIGYAYPFLVHRGILALLTHSGVILLDFLYASPTAVGAYAISLAIITPMASFVIATNRAYVRAMSVIAKAGDTEGIFELWKRRARWVLPVLTCFTVMVLLLARPLVGLFGEEFVEEGVTPLRILAVTMAISATFSLSPTYLKFTRQRSKVLKIAVATAIVQFGLLLALVPLWGATGAAIASGTSLSTMVCICTLIVLREVSVR